MREWWDKLSPTQQRIVMFGIPLVAVAALWSMRSRAASEPDEADDAPADPENVGAPPTAGRGPTGFVETGDPSAIGTGTLSNFLTRVGEIVQSADEESAAARAELAADLAALRADQTAAYDELRDTLSAIDRDGSQPSPTPAPDTQDPEPTPNTGTFDPGALTLINTTTGRAAFTGPSGEAALASAPTKADREKYGTGFVSWQMPDGRKAWYLPGVNIDPGNVAALERYAGAR